MNLRNLKDLQIHFYIFCFSKNIFTLCKGRPLLCLGLGPYYTGKCLEIPVNMPQNGANLPILALKVPILRDLEVILSNFLHRFLVFNIFLRIFRFLLVFIVFLVKYNDCARIFA